jgi:hypothetical protein
MSERVARRGSSVVYFFRIGDGIYGDPACRTVLAQLIRREPRASAGFRFHWGDYLPYHSFWAARQPVEERRVNAVRSYETASADVAATLYDDLLASARRLTTNQTIAGDMPYGRIWAIAISNQHSSLAGIDAALKDQLGGEYLGAAELDPANPVHSAVTFDTLPFYGFFTNGHLAMCIDGEYHGEILDSPPTHSDDLPWFANVGATTYSNAGYFGDTESPADQMVIRLSGGGEVTFLTPPGPERQTPSKRGLESLSLLLDGLTTYGLEQLLTGLLHLGSSRLHGSIHRWARMPDFDRPQIDERKLRDYALNPNHPTGKHKAGPIRSALGFDQVSAALLATKIRTALAEEPTIRGIKTDTFGVSWHLDLTIHGLNGRTDILRTAWIVNWDSADPVPRLTSIRMKRKQR